MLGMDNSKMQSLNLAQPRAGNNGDKSPLAGQYLRPHASWQDKVRKSFSPTQTLILAGSIIFSIICAFTVLKDEQFKDREGNDVPLWKPLFVFNLFMAFVALVMGGANPEASLVGLSALAVVFECSNVKKLFAGAASGSVTSLALLFPIVKAFNETGYPATMVGKLLGSPKVPTVGLTRMFLSVCLFSSVIMNTMVTATMIPVLITWTQCHNLDVRMFMMPLTFAVQTGGSLTLLGTSTNFVGQEVFFKSTDGAYKLAFLDLTFGSIVLCAVVGLYCIFLSPRLLKSDKTDDDEENDDSAAAAQGGRPRAQSLVEVNRNVYNVKMKVVPGGRLIGIALEETGIKRIKGVKKLTLVNQSATAPLNANDTIDVSATAEGIAALRLVRGLEIANDKTELAMLGACRRQRRLMEAVVGPALMGQNIDVAEMRLTLGCAVVSKRTPFDDQEFYDSFEHEVLNDGDVVLIEGFPSSIGSDEWLRNFGVVRIVANSAPQRMGRLSDTLRAMSIAIGLAITIVLASMQKDNLSLNVLCVLLLCFMVMIKATTVKEAYSHVNSGVLLSIVGALALGDAVESTGLANYLAKVVVAVCAPGGLYGILIGLYIAAVVLGLVITNPAVVAILGEIGTRTARAQDIPVETIALTLVWASSNCYMSPYAYASNLMVMPEGKYTWGDFIKFGAPLQLLHMIFTVLVAPHATAFNSAWLRA